MEIALIGSGILASVILYKVGYKKGKQDGHAVGYSHGMFKANELVNKQKLENESKPFARHNNHFSNCNSYKEPVWLG